MLTLGEVSRSVYTIQYEESGKDERRNNKKERKKRYIERELEGRSNRGLGDWDWQVNRRLVRQSASRNSLGKEISLNEI